MLTHVNLGRAGPVGRARRAVVVRSCQAGRARSHHLQQVQARHLRRPRALALDRIDREAAGRHGVLDRDFAELIGDDTGDGRTVPLLGFAQAGVSGAFDESGFPSGKGWSEVALPAAEDNHAFALEISGDALAPAYRDGDVILVSPGAPIRKGDRVVVKAKAGELTLAMLKRRTAKAIELLPLDATQGERTMAANDVAWIARIVWASQ